MDDRREPLPVEGGRENRPKHRGLRCFGILLGILVLVLAVVALAAWRDGTGFDALRRYLTYGDSQDGALRYEASSSNRFAPLEGGIAILSDRELTVLQEDGGEVCRLSLAMSTPGLVSCGDRAVVYDVGGTELHLVDISGERLSLKTEGAILAVELNRSGWLTVTAEADNCKSVATVYDPGGEEVFRFRSAQRFLSTASVTEDNKTLVAVALGQENGTFSSQLLFYDLSQDAEEPQSQTTVSGDLVFTLGSCGSALCALGQNGVTFLPTGGEGVRFDFANQYLRGYHFGGEGFALLQLNRYQSGSTGQLVSVDTQGTILGELSFSEEVLDISAAGRYVAVLYPDRCVVYTSALQEYGSLLGADSYRAVLQRKDGSALLMGAEEARLFVP